MRSYLLAFLVVILATEGVKALRCHTCIDYRPWPELNFTAEERGPLSLCRRDVEPSSLFLLPCLSEKEVCGQQFVHANLNGMIARYAQRGCVDPDYVREQLGWEIEMNSCDENTVDLNPIMPIGPIKTETCICDDNACNPILNYTASAVAGSGMATRNLYKSIFKVTV